MNEATKLLEEGVARSPEDIDKSMAHGGGSPFGPFQFAKGTGFEKLAKRCEELSKQFGIKAFAPTKTLKEGKF